jgi:hypothetical protein
MESKSQNDLNLRYRKINISGTKKAPGAYFLELNALASLQ